MNPPTPPPKLDRYDLRILEILQNDSSITNQQLAERISLSPSPCLRRVQALEAAGIIRKRVALLDRQRLGLQLLVIIHISMDRHTSERFDSFEAAVRQLPEVLECFMITGQDADYQIKLTVRDMNHFQDILLNRITKIEGVTGVHSSFVLREVVSTTELPIWKESITNSP